MSGKRVDRGGEGGGDIDDVAGVDEFCENRVGAVDGQGGGNDHKQGHKK